MNKPYHRRKVSNLDNKRLGYSQGTACQRQITLQVE